MRDQRQPGSLPKIFRGYTYLLQSIRLRLGSEHLQLAVGKREVMRLSNRFLNWTADSHTPPIYGTPNSSVTAVDPLTIVS